MQEIGVNKSHKHNVAAVDWKTSTNTIMFPWMQKVLE